jgi:hypothetical protein
MSLAKEICLLSCQGTSHRLKQLHGFFINQETGARGSVGVSVEDVRLTYYVLYTDCNQRWNGCGDLHRQCKLAYNYIRTFLHQRATSTSDRRR